MKKRIAALILTLLFKMEDLVDRIIDRVVFYYEGGVHPKHRLMRYHDFFVERIRPEERVLDLGCGPGVVAYSIASRSRAHVTGIDTNARNVAFAKKRFQLPNLSFQHGDALKDLPSNTFDVIVFSNVLEHIEHRVDFLKQAQSRLGPKRWLIRVPVFDRHWKVPLRKELGLYYFNDPTHYIEYTHDLFYGELQQAGFDVQEYSTQWGEIWAEARPRAAVAAAHLST